MKKAEAAAYAEAQVEGSGWLPLPLQASVVAATKPTEPNNEDGGVERDDTLCIAAE